MIWVRIFEHDKPINSSKLHDCYMGALPEVGDLVSTGGGDEEQYEVKSRLFFINYDEQERQEVALGVVPHGASNYDLSGAL